MSSFSYFVGQRIKKYRKSRGYTIEQFSAMINKSKATLSKYENGAITIDIETLYDIAQALEIDLKCFIDYQPPVFHQDTSLPKNNYFNQSLAYMYYYDGRVRQMVRSLLRFSRAADRETIEVTLYLGVASFSEPDRCQHLFTGTVLARNKDIGIGRGHFFHQKAELLHGGAVSPIHVAGICKQVAAFCRTSGIWAVGRRFCFRS